MIKIAKLSEITHEEWLELRKVGIGGSDIGAALGYNSYKNNIEVWEEKLGLRENTITNMTAVERGKKAEKPILELWEAFNVHRVKLFPCEYMYSHKKYQWIRGNFDSFGIVDDEKCIIEIKTTEVRDFSEWKDQIPMMYYLQCLHYLLISGLKVAWLVVAIKRFGSSDIILKEYKINPAEEEIELLLEKEKEFYQKIINKERPLLIQQLGG